MCDNQLQIGFDTPDIANVCKVTPQGDKPRLKIGRYATQKQIEDEQKAIELARIEIEFRRDAALWQTVRRMSEEIYTLRTRLKLRLCI